MTVPYPLPVRIFGFALFAVSAFMFNWTSRKMNHPPLPDRKRLRKLTIASVAWLLAADCGLAAGFL